MSSFTDFLSFGWSPVQAAGIVGNQFGESGMNPNAVGDGGSAYGLTQLHGDRQATFRRIMGVDIRGSSVFQQNQFTNWELNNTEKSAGNWLRKQTTLGGSTFAVMRGFERPATNGSFNDRLKAGASALTSGGGLLEGGLRLLGANGAADKLHGLTNTAMKAGASAIPGGTAALGIADGLGITNANGQGNWFDQFKSWVSDSGFFQRIGLAVLAFIIIAAAFYLMNPGKVNDAVKTAALA